MLEPAFKRRFDTIAILVLLIAVLIQFLPAMAGWRGLYHNDHGMVEFPWHYFVAQHFQRGEIPLWEPNTWCGGIPFYARYYADTYYLPLWPFNLLAQIGDLDQSYWMLALLPLLLHYWLAAVGMYVFARWGIRLRPLAAFAAAWVYIFSPAFSYSYTWFPIVAVQAWLPWLLVLVVTMDRKPGLGKVIGAAAIISLMATAAQPPHLGYGVLLAAITALALAFRRLVRRERSKIFHAPLGLLLALVFSVSLAAVYWFSTWDGLSHTEQHIAFIYDEMTGTDGSFPPLYLSTIFVPDLFGTVTGEHIWGGAVSYEARYWEANLSGGLLLTFLAFTGVLLIGRRDGSRRLRFWAGLAALIWVFALLCILGRHTPFYYVFYKLVPVLTRCPFPIRYRLFQCVAVAWLAGLGMENLTGRNESEKPWPARQVWGYLVLAVLVVVPALLAPQDVTSKDLGRIFPRDSLWVFPGVREIFLRGEAEWFIKGPVFYFLSATVLVVLIWRGFKGRTRTIAVVALVALETLFFSMSAFYFSTFDRHFSRPENFRVSRPGDHPMVQRVLVQLAFLRDRPELRWASDQPFHDDFARLEGSFALMGYDMKPLERRFKTAIEEAYDRPMDWPIYWFYPRAIHIQFLNNLAVGCLMDTNPVNPFREGTTSDLEKHPELVVHKNPEAVPRVFTLDRIVQATEDEQREELVKGDVRRGVFLEAVPPEATSAQVLMYREFREWAAQTAIGDEEARGEGDPHTRDLDLRRFEELQKENPVLRLELGYANRVEVDIDVVKPAMLVLNELWYPGWKAYRNGKEIELYRVNFLQRGVWLERGRHQVQFVFQPPAWKVGALISLISTGLTVLVVIGVVTKKLAAKKRKRFKKVSCD